MAVVETIIVVAVFMAAAFFFVRWLRGVMKGDTGCSCGKCGKGCASRKPGTPEGNPQ